MSRKKKKKHITNNTQQPREALQMQKDENKEGCIICNHPYPRTTQANKKKNDNSKIIETHKGMLNPTSLEKV